MTTTSPSTNAQMHAQDVEATLLSSSLHLFNTKGGVTLNLDVSQSLDLREGLTRLPGFQTDSIDAPIRFGKPFGTGAAYPDAPGTLVQTTARPSEPALMESKDCQVDGAEVRLVGNRLMFAKEGARTFVQLNPTQVAQLKTELDDLK